MKKKKFISIIKKSVCFFVAALIALVPLIGIPFTVSAADSGYYDKMWHTVGAFKDWGGWSFDVPVSGAPFSYAQSSDYTFLRSYWGEFKFDSIYGKTNVYQLALPSHTNTPIGLLKIYVKSNMAFQPGMKYRVIFDVTPAPFNYYWNYVYDKSSSSWRDDIPDNRLLALTTNLYYADPNSNPVFIKKLYPFMDAWDSNFADQRYKFTYEFTFGEDFTSPQYLYLSVVIPYLATLDTRLTTYFYEPVIQEYSYRSPDTSDFDSMEDAENTLFDFIDDHDATSFLDGSANVSILGTQFLKGFRGAGDLLGKFYDQLPFLKSLIFFSLTLGLSGFVLNLGTSIIRSSRKDR